MINQIYETIETEKELAKTFARKNCVHLYEFFEDLNEDKIKLEVQKFLEKISKKKLYNEKTEKKTFGKGEYRIITDTEKMKEGLYAVLDLTKKWDFSWGGYQALRENENTTILPQSYNSLFIAKVGSSTKTFTKYVNHHAKNNKRAVIIFRYSFEK